MARMNPETATFLNGPKLAAWLKERDRLPAAVSVNGNPDSLASLWRRIREWEQGDQATIDAADYWLTTIGCHLSELPDDIWEARRRTVARPKSDAFERARALGMLDGGATCSEVARALGRSTKSIENWRRQARQDLVPQGQQADGHGPVSHPDRSGVRPLNGRPATAPGVLSSLAPGADSSTRRRWRG